MNKYHFIGIGGIGMSGLAHILLEKDMEVSGSDLALNFLTEQLKCRGAKIFADHCSDRIRSDMTVVYSSGIHPDNPEYRAALLQKCPILHRSDLLNQLMQAKKGLVVAGSHGKTTTTALLTAVLIEANLHPSYVIGGAVDQFGSHSRTGEGEYFIAEADESDGTFLKYFPFGAILTNVSNDHLNYYQTEGRLAEAFNTFISQVQNTDLLIWCGDDPTLSKLAPRGIPYGFSGNCTWQILNFEQKGWNIRFDLKNGNTIYQNIHLNLIGRHNALNAAAVFALARQLNIAEESIRKAFSEFKGVSRRCEKIREMQKILVLDDYAHHPNEIKATVNAVKTAVGERRLIGIFQPHRYTRTKDCRDQFQNCFEKLDMLIVTDIYSAGEKPLEEISIEIFIGLIKKPVEYVPKENLLAVIEKLIKPHDVVLFLGAGDITQIAKQLIPTQKMVAALIYGGKSVEHEISCRSSEFILQSLDSEIYQIKNIEISKTGEWGTGLSHIVKDLLECDVIFPMLHGTNGEDGTVQGFFEILNKPYVGCSVSSCAVCMDKAFTKKIALYHKIQTAPFIDFSISEWDADPDFYLEQIRSQLEYPVFIKPVHLGSSVGISKVEHVEDLSNKISHAFQYDTHILVEQGIAGREIEFAVLGNRNCKIFPPGEILTEGKVYDYDAKYGNCGFPVISQTTLPASVMEKGVQLAASTYKILKCEGMSRIDFFLDEKNQWWLNEVNPIPGFTEISLYPQICKANGIAGSELMDQLIISALEKYRIKNSLRLEI